MSFSSMFERTSTSRAMLNPNESKKQRKEFRTKWKSLLDEGSETGKKWRIDMDELKAEIKSFVKGIADDE